MGRRGSTLPGWAQWALASGIRGAMTPALAIGPGAALAAARGLASLYPRFSPKRFQRAVDNLAHAFPDQTDAAHRALALASYQHVFQLGVEFAYAPRLISQEAFARHLVFTEIGQGLRHMLGDKPVLLISGHVGNWELLGYSVSMLGFPMHAVYRPLDLRPLDDWVRHARGRRGLTLVSKFGAVRALPPVLRRGEPVGLVADQSGGDRGIFVPYFGRLTSTYKSIGLLAMQTGATLVCGMARRLKPGERVPDNALAAPHPSDGTRAGDTGFSSLRYVVELTDVFGPADWESQPDPLYYLTARYRRAIETMVRTAPEQFFWMHRIWRSRPAHERQGKPFPAGLREKIAALPWMTPEGVAAIEATSARDASLLAKGHLSV